MASLYTLIFVFLAWGASAHRPIAPRIVMPTDLEAGGTAWALLVAGSTGIYNYRHQADVCHAFQILKKGGIKEENIVVFMYDDIVDNEWNPSPGYLVNNWDAIDVYAGVPKDYTGANANKQNLLAVLQGDKSSVTGGSGKVIDSKPGDRIFMFYAGHGGPGVLEMPGSLLFANDLVDALKQKHASGTYEEMVIYLEACESGSIFEGLLPNDLNIYAMTAANAEEDSWATYCFFYKFGVNCLGDLFSVGWMEDSESNDRTKETIAEQYEKVKQRSSVGNTYKHGSHVMEYGTTGIRAEMLNLYQGSNIVNAHSNNINFTFDRAEGLVKQRDADLHFMMHRYERLDDASEEKVALLEEIAEMVKRRENVDRSVASIGELLFGAGNGPSVLKAVRPSGQALVDDWACLKSMVEVFEEHCGALMEYGLKHTRAFANICNEGVGKMARESACKKVCGIKTYA